MVKAPERRVKGDTIVYDVAAMTKAGDRNIEDVIKKIPGIQVDDSGGISYDGEPINHFYIEGLDLMGATTQWPRATYPRPTYPPSASINATSPRKCCKGK